MVGANIVVSLEIHDLFGTGSIGRYTSVWLRTLRDVITTTAIGLNAFN